MCMELCWLTSTFPNISSLVVTLSLFLGAEARSLDYIIPPIICNACTFKLSLGSNLDYYTTCIELCWLTSTFPSISSLVVALSLFLGEEEARSLD